MNQPTNLQGLNVLITRPEQQATSLAQAIVAVGGTPIIFPTVVITPVEQKAIKEVRQQWPSCDIIIFLSANAVQISLPHWPPLSSRQIVLAIGPATAKALQQAGIKQVVCPTDDHSSEGLLSLPVLESVINKRIMIVTGAAGRSLLPDTLRSQGAEVIMAVVYERSRPSIDMLTYIERWRREGLGMIVCTSRDNLLHLYAMTPAECQKWIRTVPIVVISARLQHLAAQLGFRQILLAKGASDAAILAELKAWYAKHRQKR